MNNGKLGRILMIPMALAMAVTMAAMAACTPTANPTATGTPPPTTATTTPVTPTTPATTTTSTMDWGIVEIRATDPGPANVTSAVVYLSNLEVHMAGNDVTDNTSGNATSSDNTSGWITVLGAPASFDLMNVLGVEQILGSANLTAGKYTQIRMDVTKVTGVTTDNISYSAEVPSDKLKIVGTFDVGDGNKTTLTLDFDGSKSLIQTGQGKFLFKPVVKLLVNSGGQTTQGGGTGKPNDTGKPSTTGNSTGAQGNKP